MLLFFHLCKFAGHVQDCFMCNKLLNVELKYCGNTEHKVHFVLPRQLRYLLGC